MQLNRYEDVVHSTVGRAVKEMSTEKVLSYIPSKPLFAFKPVLEIRNKCFIIFIFKVLSEVTQMWERMEFSYEDHYRTVTPLLKCSDELIERLEESQVPKRHIQLGKQFISE